MAGQAFNGEQCVILHVMSWIKICDPFNSHATSKFSKTDQFGPCQLQIIEFHEPCECRLQLERKTDNELRVYIPEPVHDIHYKFFT